MAKSRVSDEISNVRKCWSAIKGICSALKGFISLVTTPPFQDLIDEMEEKDRNHLNHTTMSPRQISPEAADAIDAHRENRRLQKAQRAQELNQGQSEKNWCNSFLSAFDCCRRSSKHKQRTNHDYSADNIWVRRKSPRKRVEHP